MASSYVRHDSPVYWVRIKQADGSWKSEATQIRLDEVDGPRKLKMKLLELQMKEMEGQPSGGGKVRGRGMARGWGWVPEYLGQHYHDPKSLQRAMNAWAAVGVWLDWKRLRWAEQVTFEHGHEYVKWRQDPPKGTVKARAKNTALLEVKIFSKIMQGAVRKGLAKANPLYRLGIPRDAPKEKPEILPEEQVKIQEALLSAPQWMQDQWLVAMKHGCRLREVAVPMVPSRINLAQRVIVFEGKKKKLHAAPLHRDCEELVRRRMEEGAAFLVDLPEAPSKHWWKFFRGLGLGHLSFHSTRVTVVTRLVLAGVPEAQTMKYVGHSSVTVHRVYQRHRPSDVDHVGKML